MAASPRAALGFIGQVLSWLVILGVAATLSVAVLVPRAGGATPYVVLTSSMEPTMPPGTMVVARPVDPAKLGIGSVVTYQIESGEPTVVTHRVVAVSINNRSGERVFRTQGDANDSPDREWVRPVQIRGERWYSVPYAGRVTNVLDDRHREWAVSGVAAALLAYAAFMFGGALRDRRRSSGGEPG